VRITPLLLTACLCAGVTVRGDAQAERNARHRVLLVDSTVLQGRLVAWEANGMVLSRIVRPTSSESELVQRVLPLDSIAAAWVRSGTHWKQGGVIGTVVGAVGAVGVGLVTLETQDGSSCDTWCWTSATAAGAAAGALLGAFVGHQFGVWRPLRL
jgi:hypothetical protein